LLRLREYLQLQAEESPSRVTCMGLTIRVVRCKLKHCLEGFFFHRFSRVGKNVACL
jgi:hypothetical protein